ncbi:MAG: serine/threonine-protein kinase [Planctomycetota bacterium]
MNDGKLSQEFEVFLETLERAPAERAAFLEERCAQDGHLRDRVLELLAGHDRAEDHESSVGPGWSVTSQPGTPKAIGPYVVLSRLGEGGMGVVYAAEQSRPIRRRVAVKVLKTGSDSREVLARFDAERQALALMNHANLAQILDAGMHEGRPYFVMELIAGVPVTEYCDRRRLTIAERLELFIRVCEGVQHAHQKGIIHRDLKPTNVLVSEDGATPTPKIIDFGIAKAITNRLLEATVHTEIGRIIGTPDYMSPEQADVSALDIDTRSDVYSLGALLYELLCGTTVFGLYSKSAGLDAIRSTILNTTPSRPSDRLFDDASTTTDRSNRRGSSSEALGKLLRRDLDWIVLKALEKDRVRRYSSASELAGDVQRFLDGATVVARPPSTTYRIGKFVKRHRGTVVAGGAVSFALAAATAVSIAFGIAARHERNEAQRRAGELERVATFEAERLSALNPQTFGATIRDDILELAPDADAERIREAIKGVNFTTIALGAFEHHFFDDTLDAIDTQFEADPGIRATLLQSTASIMAKLGLLDQAMPPQADALELRTTELGPDHALTADSLAAMAGLLKKRGQFREAEPIYADAIQRLRKTRGPDAPELMKALNEYGLLLQELAMYDQAMEAQIAALNGFRTIYGDNNRQAVKVLNEIGLLLFSQGQTEAATERLIEALEASRAVYDADEPEFLAAITNVGGALIKQGRLKEGAPYFEEALAGFRVVHGDDHPTTLILVSNMGYLLQEMGRFDEAEAFYLESLEARRRLLGPDHVDTLTSELNLSNLYVERGTPEQGLHLLAHVIATRTRDLGHVHPSTVNAVNNLASLHNRAGNPDQALEITAGIISETLPALPPKHSLIGSVWRQHAEALLGLERFNDAIVAAERSRDARVATYGTSHRLISSTDRWIADTYDKWHEASPGQGHDVAAKQWRSRANTPD